MPQWLSVAQLIGIAGVVGLAVGAAAGYRLATWEGTAARVALERQVTAAAGNARAQQQAIGEARGQVAELEREYNLRRRPEPAVEFITREIVREIEGPLLPAGACASDRFAGMLDVLSGADRARADAAARDGPRVPARAPGAAAAAIPAAPGITAEQFQRWAVSAEQQYRTAVARSIEWERFVRRLPCIQFPARDPKVTP